MILPTPLFIFFFFFNDTATTEIYTLSLHDALPISGDQPVRTDLAARFCELGANIAADQLRCSGARDGQRVTGGAEHLPEAKLPLRNQFRIFAPGGNDGRRNLVRPKRLCFLNAEVSRQRAKFRLAEPELWHARLFLGFVAIDGDVAVLVHNRARFLEPFVNPFAADFRADAREVRAEHRGPLDALHFVATLAIEFGQELAAARKLRRLRQIGLMAGSAGSLDEVRGQDRLLPGERGLVSFGDFRGRPLAAMTNRAAPLAHVVRNRRMRAKRLRNRLIRKARLRDSLMAGGAAVDHVHSGEPDLINARAVIGGQPLRIRATLRKAQIRTFVLLPLAAGGPLKRKS